MDGFKEISARELPLVPFDIKDNWMLITAQKEGKVNTMTANWGGFGYIWHKEAVFIVIRPQRYTKEFVDSSESFSLTLFDKSFQKKLAYLGKASGRDEDKIEKVGLTVAYKDGIPYFKEADMVIFCKKLFAQPLTEESFIDRSIIEQWYPGGDFHTLYIGEIRKAFVR